MEDPAHATGTDEEIDAAFAHTYRVLRARIEAFLALPLDELKRNSNRLKLELDRIGSLSLIDSSILMEISECQRSSI